MKRERLADAVVAEVVGDEPVQRSQRPHAGQLGGDPGEVPGALEGAAAGVHDPVLVGRLQCRHEAIEGRGVLRGELRNLRHHPLRLSAEVELAALSFPEDAMEGIELHEIELAMHIHAAGRRRCPPAPRAS